MGVIGTVEDYLIARVQAALGAKLRAVDSLPGVWTDETIAQLLRTRPGAYVSFLGGGASARQGNTAAVEARWAVYGVTGHASGQAARRRGHPTEIGAYEILETVIPLLHNHVVPDVGTLVLREVNNLFTERADLEGLAIYAAIFSLPMGFEVVPDPAGLAPFVTFHHELAVGQTPDTVNPEGRVTLEQGP
jgi:phage gp37-like protein